MTSIKDLEPLLGAITPNVARAIDSALSGDDLSIDDTVVLKLGDELVKF